MVTVCEEEMTEGAVYNPFDKVPVVWTQDQTTDVFEGPVTLAANCVLCDDVSVTLEGLRLMLMPPDVS